jgi:opacity protein-like surface antigen
MKKIFLIVLTLSYCIFSFGQDKMFELSARAGYSPTARFGNLPEEAPGTMTIHGLAPGLDFNYLLNNRFSVGFGVWAAEYDGLYNDGNPSLQPGDYLQSLALDYQLTYYNANFKAYVNPGSRFSLYGRFRIGYMTVKYPNDSDGEPNLDVYQLVATDVAKINYDPGGTNGYNEFVENNKGVDEICIGLSAGLDISILPILGLFVEASYYDVTGSLNPTVPTEITSVGYDPNTNQVEIASVEGSPNMFFIDFGAYIRFGNKKF